MPEISEVSKNIIIEETKQGLNIEIVDQNGRSMFPEGSKEPYERTRPADPASRRPAAGDAVPHLDFRPHLGDKLPPRQATDRGTCRPTAPTWCASISETEGVPGRTSSWWPAAPTPSRCFPTTPIIAANRRVTITLMREEPPIPQIMQP